MGSSGMGKSNLWYKTSELCLSLRVESWGGDWLGMVMKEISDNDMDLGYTEVSIG